MASPKPDSLKKHPKKKPDPVGEASKESFPASDPPSFNPGTAAPAPLPEDPPPVPKEPAVKPAARREPAKGPVHGR